MIREPDTSEFGKIAELEKNCFGMPWSEEDIRSIFGRFSCIACDEEGGRIRGYIFFNAVADDAEILRICVDEKERRKGIGLELIGYCLKKAKEAGCSSLFLEVRRSNTGAVSLYEKAGFRKIYERKDYYGPGCDALVYALKIQQ